MSIVGGLNIHRKQLTFDWVDEQNDKWERGRITPADREHLAKWLTRFDPATSGSVAFAMEGCTGWRYIAEEMDKAGVTAHLAEPAETSGLRGPKRRAKTDKADAKLLRELLATGRLPECYIPPAQVLEWRALLELYQDPAHRAHRLGATHPIGVLPPGHHRTQAGRDRPRRPGPAPNDHRRAVVDRRPAPDQHRPGHDGHPRRSPRPAAAPAAVDRPRHEGRPGVDARHLRRRAAQLPRVVRLARRPTIVKTSNGVHLDPTHRPRPADACHLICRRNLRGTGDAQ
jgi:hypothetical protein